MKKAFENLPEEMRRPELSCRHCVNYYISDSGILAWRCREMDKIGGFPVYNDLKIMAKNCLAYKEKAGEDAPVKKPFESCVHAELKPLQEWKYFCMLAASGKGMAFRQRDVAESYCSGCPKYKQK